MIRAFSLFLLCDAIALAGPLRIDFDVNTTQAGWESITAADMAQSDSWSREFSGGVVVDVLAVGSVVLDTRDRGTINGGPESDMWRDFLFASGSRTTNEGVDIRLSGLMPHTDYPIRIWGFDTGSPANRRSTWNGHPYAFDGSDPAATSLADHALGFTNTTDATGTLLIEARTDLNPGPTHNVFINGLELGDPVLAFLDADLDGLDDRWEERYFTNITFAVGTNHYDADLLDNLAEQTRGTDPRRADTDRDGLRDDQENGSRVYNGPGDPGSDPVLADTDDDSISDGDEISLANGFVTNPNLADSDDDGYWDALEIALGHDPTDQLDHPDQLPLVINEVMAINATGLVDGFGNTEDWIELYNPNTNAVPLEGFHLTDNPANLVKWTFPAISIPAMDVLLVFASGRNTNDLNGTLHTSFKLAGDGEYLALVRPDGTTIEDAFTPTLPPQVPDISYGRSAPGAALRYFDLPTPGGVNGIGFSGVVADTRFSFDRGFYTNAIQVAITSATTTATIRYTLDGGLPNPTTGFIYSGPIPVASNTILRAVAVQDDWLPTNVDTHTYLFIDQVTQQRIDPPGWPDNWGVDSEIDGIDGAGNGTVFADYEMDPRVVTNALPGYSVAEALLDLPSISIVMDLDDFVGASSGIWSHPRSRIEKVCSVEWLNPDGSRGFQQNAEIEVHGNSSRRPVRMNKHSLRLTFKAALGAGKLNYPVIPDYPVETFNKLVLRACFTDSWALVTWGSGRYRPNDSQYIRDVWMKKTMADMGHPSTSGTFAHVYVNGIYFGLFNPAERIDETFCADHLGGVESDYDVMGDFDTTVSGSDRDWDAMFALAAGGLTSTQSYAAIQPYLDLENFADYMLLHFYGDAEDWPSHNGYAFRNRTANEPFRWLVWDQEIILDNYAVRRYDNNNAKSPGFLFQQLRTNPEFRRLFSDRVYHHCFNQGALSMPASQQRYAAIAARIDKAIVAESARWGDTQMRTPYGNTLDQPANPNNPDDLQYPSVPHGPDFYFTREEAWVVERDNVITNYIPSIFDASNPNHLLAELRAENLYPAMDPPGFNQHGGPVGAGFTVTLSNAVGTAFYTLDGSDPISTNALVYSGPVTLISNPTVFSARVWDGIEWSALARASFSLADLPTASNLVVSEMYYNPPGNDEAEFVELLNVGMRSVTLDGLQFSNAVAFVFGDELLDPGERILVVENTSAFTNAFPGVQARVAGQWSGRLDNAGDRLVVFHTGSILHDISYLPVAPWPMEANGVGASLEYIGGPSSTASSWRKSCSPYPTPGTGREFCPPITFPDRNTARFDAVPGETYRMEVRDSLHAGDWLVLETLIADEPMETLTIPDAPRRYYRLVWVRQ